MAGDTTASNARALAKAKRLFKNAGNDIKAIRNKGALALTTPGERIMFRGMVASLNELFRNFLELLESATELSESTEAEPSFPSLEDTAFVGEVKNSYYEALGFHQKILDGTKPPTTSGDRVSLNQTIPLQGSRTILPRISIKPFHGELTDWSGFKQLFTSLIIEELSLNNAERFHYLRSYLGGPALDAIKHIKEVSENFTQAWDALCRVYDNERKLACTYLNSFLKFKATSGKPTADSLQQYISRVMESINSLKNLNIPDFADYLLCELALQSLDPKTREDFELSIVDTKYPKVATLQTFVQNRCQVLRLTQDAATPCEQPKQQQPSKPVKSPNHYTFKKPQHALMAHTKDSGGQKSSQAAKPTNNNNKSCYICSKPHTISSCPAFQSSTPQQRLDLLKLFPGCRNCLHPHHRTKACPSNFTCRECGLRHHTNLHLPLPSSSSEEQHNLAPDSLDALSPSPMGSNKSPGFSGTNTAIQRSGVLLGTVVAQIIDNKGKLHRFRGVLDQGSQYSFITEKCARQLGQSTRPFKHRISGVNNSTLNSVVGQVSLSFHNPSSSSPLTTEAVVVPAITPPLPQENLASDLWYDYTLYNLSDPEFTTPGPISFLVGADLYPEVVTGAPITIHDQGPKLISTIFGFTVLGRFVCSAANQNNVALLSHTDVSSLVERFWELEEPVNTHTKLSPEEQRCEEHFVKTHTRDATGRFVLRYPFKSSPPSFQLNTQKIFGQFRSLESRTQRDVELGDKYQAFMREYLELGHMSPASTSPAYLIPHHPILRKDNGKIRVVFDASYRTSSGSLNDHLLTGPKLQADICDIVLHFQRFTYVLTCDLVKMFRQILIAPEDRQYQQIIWRPGAEQPIQHFELNTVTYGLSCSPYLAQRVLHQLVHDDGATYPEAATALMYHTYVDDIAYGSDTVEGLFDLKTQLIALLAKGGFTLDKWNSNHPPLLDNHTSDQQTPVQIHSHEPSIIKILGMQWDPSTDAFSYSVTPPEPVCTKRNILSAIARLFDPLGYLSPVIFYAKCLFQETWKAKVDWDDQVPEVIAAAWRDFTYQLPQLGTICIPRPFPKTDSTYQFICFCDASEKGYCAAVYLRATQGNVAHMKLLKSKTKLSPLKSITIPRLELCGALLLSQLLTSLDRLKQSLNISTVYCFTDSMVVLAWLKTPTYLLQTFVGNRVQQILDATPLESWHHVKGAENPADVGSRGVMPSDLHDCSLWWSGPDWCFKPVDQWPISTDTSAVDIPELKPTMLSLVAVQSSSFFLKYTTRHSSFLRLVRVMAFVKRFLFNSRIPKQKKLCRRKGPLSATEFNQAKHHCIRIIQHSFYPQAFITSNYDQLPLELRRLAVFVDQDGLLRVGGRLQNAPLSPSQKHPILLPSRSHFTSLVVDYYHRLNHHVGPNALMASIRQEYWVPSARNLVKLVKRQCVVCIRFSKQTLFPLMGNLPASRFSSVRPFLHTGVDFGGPFLCKLSSMRKAPTVKTYMCLYICLSTRAVHIELALGLSIEDFLDTFDRFVARRGIPAVMYSDNGTNFVGTAGYLRDVYEWFNRSHTQASLVNHTSHLSIDWKFNPPLSPHMGGAWEAGIKAAKALIHKSFGDRSYTSWELATMFTKVEGILNSRPLQPISDCPEDLDALTPGHFIIGQPITALPEMDYSDLPANRLNAWELVRERVQFFWTRWREEYVCSLQARDKWINNPPNLKVGSLVLVSDLQTPPARWPMARVLQVHPGADRVVRVVTLKTAKGVFKRPVVKLIPLVM